MGERRGLLWEYVPSRLSFKEALTWSTKFCWGGKVVSLTSGAGTPWKVAAQCHPGRLSADDAAKVTIPMCILASNEENSKDVEAFDKALTVEKHVETFETQIHGWLSARGDLEDENVNKEYLRGYELLSGWFGKHIGGISKL